jgi:hypothetical protein
VSQEPPINYEAVLNDLERQKADIQNIQKAIDALRLIMSLGTLIGPAGAPTARPLDPQDIPSDAFFGLSIGEAAKKYLTIVKRKQTIQEIADALDRGGLPHSSTDFLATVRAMINRLAKSDTELVRVGPGAAWGLSSWYGNRRPKEAPAKPKGKRRKKSAGRPKEQQAAKPATPPAAKPSLTIVQQAEEVLKAAGSPLLVDALIEQIERRFSRKVAKTTLVGILSERIRKQQTFTRPAPNTYALAATTLH